MVQFGKLACGGFCLALGVQILINAEKVLLGAALVIISLPILASATRKALRLPPGPKGLPILGYLPFLTPMPHKHMAELAQKYGPLVHFRMGQLSAIVIASPAMMKEVLMTQDQVFAARPQGLSSSKYFAYSPDEQGRAHGCAGVQLGPYFRSVRRLYSTEIMSAKRLGYFKLARVEEMQTMVRGLWEDSVGGSKPVDLRRMVLIPMSNNVVTYMISRKRYHGKDQTIAKEAAEIRHLVNEVTKMSANFSIANFFPVLAPLTAYTSTEREMAATGKRMDAYLQSLLDDRRANLTTDESDKTLVDVVLSFDRADGTVVDDRTSKCLILEMLLAGTETTATMVEWTMAELMRHPHMMRKLQAELDAVVGTSRFVQEEDMPSLPYLSAVFNESSRLHPPSPLLFPHANSKATTIEGYDIPAHSRIFLNTWAIGRDPKVWENPTEFNPERFMVNKKIDYKGQSFNLLPFGSGRRICAGMPLGYIVVKLAVAYLVQSFEWLLPEEMNPMEISIEEKFGLALTMKHPLSSHEMKARLPLHLYARN